MKRGIRWAQAAVLLLGCMTAFGMKVDAHAAEASQAVESYVEGMEDTEITLLAADDTEVTVTAGELGVYWANPELVSEAAEVGSRGNVIERYKLLKDLEKENLVLPIEISFDLQAISDILLERCAQYDVKAEDATLVRENGEFRVVGGRTGYALDVETSVDMAGSYMNGKVVDSLGGGICQVSTTLYNAVLLAELEVTERNNHSMIVTYVDPSADAAIAESSGKDFKFVNNLEYPVYIEGITQNKRITFTIYGKETRDAGREVRYESEVLEVNRPPADMLYADASKPLGYLVYDSAHIGYKARLWKVVLENGTEVSRTQVNSSSYKMVPRSGTVGTATEDPAAYEEIMAAIGTGNLDHVKNVIAILTAPPEENSDESGDE